MATSGAGAPAGDGSAAILDLLKKVPIFQFLSPQELSALASRMSLSTYEAGKVVFHEDEPGSTLQVIAAGSVRIYIPAEGGEEAPLALLNAGDCFGELALLDGGSRTASAVTLARTAIVTLERDEFLRFVTNYSQGAAAVFRSLAALIRKQNSQLYGQFFGG